MLVSGIPVNTLATETEEEYYSDVQEDMENSETSENDTSGPEISETDPGDTQENQNEDQDSEETPEQQPDQQEEDTTFEKNQEESTTDSEDESVCAAAVFDVLWSDEDNIADRRKDTDLSDLFQVYQNGQLMEMPLSISQKGSAERYIKEGIEIAEYRIDGLPVADSEGNPYSYSVRENIPDGYAALNENALTGLSQEEKNVVLAEVISPSDELPLTLEEESNTYTADKKMGNYLPEYAFSGTIT